MRSMRGGKKVLAVMRRRSQRVGTIHLRFTSTRVTSTGRRRASAAITPWASVVVAGPGIGEKDDLERRFCHFQPLAEPAEPRVIAHPCGRLQSLVLGRLGKGA